jgi:integrase
MGTHLTDAFCRRLEPPAKGNRITYDDDVPGFGVRVTTAGAKSFILNYTTRGGRERRYTIGSTSSWQTTAARAKAKELRRLIDDGGDPLADIEAEREAPMVSDLADRFEAEHLPRKRARTADDYRRILRLHVRPALKHLKVAEVAFADIDRLHHKVTKESGPYQANRTIAVLSKMLALAVRWKWRADNPCKGIERNREYERRRYLSGDELAKLTVALQGARDQQSANAIRLLLLTGARRGEVLGMRWADVDLAVGTWSKPPSSTKQRESHIVPLSAPARQLLSEIADEQADKHHRHGLGEHVFPGNGDSGHLREIKRTWRTLTRRAGLENLRLHDLRHSFASELVSSGASLPLIGALLGHSQVQTTARYSHLYDDPLRKAVERVGAIVEAAGNGKPSAETVSLKRRGR